MEHLFERKNPFENNCKDSDCRPCASVDPKKPKLSKCKSNNVCYEAKCETCGKLGKSRTYTGETARNLHERSKEHYNGLKMNDKNNWMMKHITNEHDGKKDEVEFSWKVLRKHNKPLQRQLHEAVRIKNKHPEEILNSKSEFQSQRIRRIEIENSYDCKVCSSSHKSKNAVQEHYQNFHQRYNCDQCEYKSFGSSGLLEHIKNKNNMTN